MPVVLEPCDRASPGLIRKDIFVELIGPVTLEHGAFLVTN